MERKLKSIYFSPEWQQLFADREGYPLERVNFSGEYGSVEYGFMKRPIEIKGEKFDYVDIVTPYAFAGPWLEPKEDTPTCRKALAAEFDTWFQDYCCEHKIVAEYVQFDPFSKNHIDFEDIYDTSFHMTDVAIDVTKNDILMEELSKSRRRTVRKALDLGVKVYHDFSEEKIDDFLRMYENTVAKYDAAEYYRYDHAFIQKIFDLFPGRAFFSYAVYEGNITSILLSIRDGKYTHGFLAGNDPNFLFTNSASLLEYDIACLSKKDGAELHVLGGADGALMDYKQSFTRNGFYDYYVGRKVRNPEVYAMLTQKNGVLNTKYFPAYRDNGATQYDASVLQNDC